MSADIEIVCPHCRGQSEETMAPDPQLIPAHRHILEASGWLGYVEANLDVLQYYPWREFEHPDGPALGLARYENGLRVAQIATEGWDDITLVSAIVHEAAHLAGIAQQGTHFDEDIAEAVERRFLSDVHAIRGRPEPYQWQTAGWSVVGVLVLCCFLALQILISASWNGETVVTSTPLRLRAWPTISSAVITVIDRDVPVLVLGRFFDWLKVEHEGHVGFVYVSYVSRIAAEPAGVRWKEPVP